MKIQFLNNDGGGYASFLDVNENITVDQFFRETMSGREPDDYLIRVNRQPVAQDYVLQENDRIAFTPLKIEGATNVM